MDYQLWAIDASAGEAVISQGHRWFLLSVDYDWTPRELMGVGEALRWAMSGPVMPVDLKYKDQPSVVAAVRRICLVALRAALPMSSGKVQRLIAQEEEALRESVEEDQRLELLGASGELVNNDLLWRRRMFELVRAYTRRLDRYFESKGFSRENSIALRGETFRRINENRRVLPRPVDVWVFSLARDVLLDRYGKRAEKAASFGEAKEGSVRTWWLRPALPDEWIGVLETLTDDALLCLGLWAGPDAPHSYEDISKGLHLPLREVRNGVSQAAKALGRPPEQLRDSALQNLCQRLIRARLTLSRE